VSLKPKLQPVPEGTPSNGGPLTLMELPGSNGAASGAAMQQLACGSYTATHHVTPNGHHAQPMVAPRGDGGVLLPPPLPGSPSHAGIPGLDPALDDFVDFDQEEDDEGGRRQGMAQLPSTGSLAHQLQLTRVHSATALAAQGEGMGAAGAGLQQHPTYSPHSHFNGAQVRAHCATRCTLVD
jgi:hypothetical protein